MKENLYTKGCIRTFTGQYVNVFDPNPDTINIYDIAHALSMQPRFGGHLPIFYSVAQHSILCCELAGEESKLQALMHDASEAYLMDIPSPIKQRLTNYKEIESNLMNLIAEKFGFDPCLSESTKHCDEYVLQWEWSRLMLGKDVFKEITCLSPNMAKTFFLDVYFTHSKQHPLPKP